MGRTIAIGDIHGCDTALDVLLRSLDLEPDDTVISLGDVIDRGPDSRRCIELLIDLKSRCHFLHIMGNHEEMMLEALHGGERRDAWQRYGGLEFMASYGGRFDGISPEHLDFIRSGRDYIETETSIFSHATIQGEYPLEVQDKHWLRWSRFTSRTQPHFSGKRVVCGHTAQPSGRPLVIHGWVCIDTCVYCPGGALTALDVDNDLVYQAEQSGRFRGCFPLEDFVQ